MHKPKYCPSEIYAIAPACEVRCLECTEQAQPSSCKDEIESLRIKQSLRLGNIVADEDGSPLVVMRIADNSIVGRPINQDYALVYAKCGAVGLLYPQPIPLTEELLLKCGFVRSESNTAIYLNYGTSLLVSFPKEYQGQFSVKFNGLSFEHIEHLHQLQNLIFALTGKELEINL